MPTEWGPRRPIGVVRRWAGLAVAALVAADVWIVAASSGSASHEAIAAQRPVAAEAHVSPTGRTIADAVDAAESAPSALVGVLGRVLGASAFAAGTSPGSVPDRTPAPSASATPVAPATSKPVVIDRGKGKFTGVAAPASTPAPDQVGRVVRYTVEVEDGLWIDATDFAATVTTVLGDPRGWQARDGVHFVNVAPADRASGAGTDLRILLASPETTDSLCAPLRTRGEVSCHNGGKVVLNSRRWLLGAEAYGTDLAGYRTYLVNHEVGHGIGHGHTSCPAKGKPAPVMMQQTYGLDGCTAWPWPTAKPA